MADVSKLKKAKSRLGTPPSAEETATGLVAPEVAPLAQESQSIEYEASEPESIYVRRDGRSARKTHRTLAFATRVTIEYDKELREIAERDGLLLVEVLEESLKAYKEKKGY
ncbi:hypothetical protein [Morganella morganii]|uniref:hypothetical protein n=1 Tax=Morganella morganii TaxID=582 RepID=UPI001A35EE14|nr:hypothetical protein [Morganella morganii]HDF2365469.1 hypothetical protein [Morganella morganii]HDF2424031.1 hypothetical protein [Morganella morganii]HED3891737.1 hypothetical protein [Morganella morganii]